MHITSHSQRYITKHLNLCWILYTKQLLRVLFLLIAIRPKSNSLSSTMTQWVSLCTVKKRISNITFVERGVCVRFMDHQMFKMFYDIRAVDERVLCHVHHSISLGKGVNKTISISINKASETGFDNQTNVFFSTHSLRHHIQNPSSLITIFRNPPAAVGSLFIFAKFNLCHWLKHFVIVSTGNNFHEFVYYTCLRECLWQFQIEMSFRLIEYKLNAIS